MNSQGFCLIRKDATTGVGLNLETFYGQTCRVMEFASDGSVLVVNNEGTAAAMFDAIDVVHSFKCGFVGNVLTPPYLKQIEQFAYASKVLSRKGGYNDLLLNMVITASINKNEFNDNFLFQKQ